LQNILYTYIQGQITLPLKRKGFANMFKLLLVDDFFVERENVKDIIQESNLDIEVIGECSNGIEALEFLEKQLPDFLLVDVEMPFMNGLELAEEVRRRYPQIKIIFFSFYDKFEYAQKAIDLEAYAYILKPIVKEEMIDSLQKVINEKKMELMKQEEDRQLRDMLEKSRPLLVDKFKRDLFFGIYKDEEEIQERISYFGLPIVRGMYLVCAVEIDDYSTTVGLMSFEQREFFSIQVSKIIDEEIFKFENCMWTKTDDSHWGILFSSTSGTVSRMQEFAYDLAGDCISRLNERNISVSVGVSPVFDSIASTYKAYEQAMCALQYKFNLGKGQIINFEDIQDNSGEYRIELDKIQEKIIDILLSKKKCEGEYFVEQVFSHFEKNVDRVTIKNLCFSLIICIQIALNDWNMSLDEIFGSEQLIWEKLLKFETIIDVKRWLMNIITFIIDYVDEKSTGRSKSIVQEAKEYIRHNYHRDISVQSVADELHYNANYLNNIFKEDTGETILEYITRIRMEAAKKLLAEEQHVKMYEICEKVGYKSVSYFRNIFKRHTGLSPKEYKDKIGKV